MRANKMNDKKLEDYIALLTGGVSGCFAYIEGMPLLNITSEFMSLCWSCFVAFCVAIAGWVGKKLVEENWPKLKSKFKNLFKRKKNVDL